MRMPGTRISTAPTAVVRAMTLTPPSRYATTTFERYAAQTPSQADALRAAQALAASLRDATPLRRWWKGVRGLPPVPVKGLYLVGPVGTGKTHLLAALYHDLHPEIPCAFTTARALLRSTHTPEADAARIARQFRVLLVDEIEIDDPASEARIILTLKALARRGVTVVATSNVEPEKFLATTYGGDRFRRFLMEEFREDYQVVLVGGDDYRRRLPREGRAWIGPETATRTAMRAAFDADDRPKHWLDFADFVALSTRTEHTKLVDMLGNTEALYLHAIAIDGTDNALRLLRFVDDLYLLPTPPTLYFTSETPPEAWFTPETLHGTLEKGIAEKFSRTVSRLQALCAMERVEVGKGSLSQPQISTS